VIFGTYRCPDHEPAAFGVNEPTPRSYLAQLVHPLLPRLRPRRRLRKERRSESSQPVPA
jgi:hypothetical protein